MFAFSSRTYYHCTQRRICSISSLNLAISGEFIVFLVYSFLLFYYTDYYTMEWKVANFNQWILNYILACLLTLCMYICSLSFHINMEYTNKWQIYIIVDKLLFEMPVLELGINKAWFWSKFYAIWAKKSNQCFSVFLHITIDWMQFQILFLPHTSVLIAIFHNPFLAWKRKSLV